MWIEICGRISRWSRRYASRPARALWIEIKELYINTACIAPSRPARALWIEILCAHGLIRIFNVEAREGLVD